MKSLSIPSIALLFACGGTNPDLFTEYVPGQEGRIDGSVWVDGQFNSPEAKDAFCAENPDAWFCSELGTAEQAWTSYEYHGGTLLSSATCYGPGAASNADCAFPNKRKFRLIINHNDCFEGASPPNGPSTLQEQAMLDGFRNQAVSIWNGVGGITVCRSGAAGCSPTDSSFMNVYINCEVEPGQAAGDSYALGGLIGTVSTPVGNAPVGPHSGKDVDDLKVSDLGHITVVPANIWPALVTCYGTDATANEIASWSQWTTAHEFGHVLGFSHFNSTSIGNLMYPFRPGACNAGPNIGIQLSDAINAFNPSSSGGVTITNGGLQNLLPQ
jgi:hypothetical protein